MTPLKQQISLIPFSIDGVVVVVVVVIAVYSSKRECQPPPTPKFEKK